MPARLTDVFGFLRQQGPRLLTHRPKGARCQCGLHHVVPVHLHEAPEEEEAYPDRAGCFFYWDNAPIHTASIVWG